MYKNTNANFRKYSALICQTDSYAVFCLFSEFVDSSMSFLNDYSSVLDHADGSSLSRTITSSVSDPVNDEQCAAYCQVANAGCMMYYYDTEESVCYSGSLTSTSGSWEIIGERSVKFNQGTYFKT